MRRTYLCAACVTALTLCGCAQSGRNWDNPLYQQSINDFAQSDEQTSLAKPVPDTPIALSDTDQLTLGDAIRYAISTHPDLRSAGYAVQAAAGHEEQAGLYPNPTFAFEAESLGARDGEAGETAYMIEQEIILGSKLAKAQRVAQAQQAVARAAFTAQTFELANRVTHGFVIAAAAQERLIQREELLELAEQLLDAANAQVQAGAATEPDRLRAQLVSEQAKIQLHNARLDLNSANTTLAAAIGLDAPIAQSLAFDLSADYNIGSQDEVIEHVLRVNTGIQTAHALIEESRRAHDLAKAQAIPNLVVSAGPQYSDIDSESTIRVGIGIEIPLFDRNQGEIRAAFAERLAAAATLGSTQLALTAQASNAWNQYESARQTAQSYQESLVPKARKTLDLTRQAYQSGKADYLRLLDAQQVYIQSRIALVDALERLGMATADINELMHNDNAWQEPAQSPSTDNEVTQ